MRITVDATPLLLPSAGVRNYVHYWLSALTTHVRETNDHVGTFPPWISTASTLNHQCPAWRDIGALTRLAMVNFCNVRGNPCLDVIARRADVFHASQHLANTPRVRRLTATVYDFSCWIRPDTHTPKNVAATRHYAERILKPSDALIAISQSSRNDAIEILGISPDRISVIYPGIPDSFFTVTDEEAKRVRARYGLQSPYLLFVGCIEPRKNVPALIRAHQILPPAINRDVQLVLAGTLGWNTEEVLPLLRSARNVRHLGYIPEADLPGLVRSAAALAYPSFYEGFGLPVAQAMAAGVPVIASDRSSLPELVGDGGLLVNPDSIEQLSAALAEILLNADLATRLGQKARARVAALRWPQNAIRSLAFFHQVVGQGTGPLFTTSAALL